MQTMLTRRPGETEIDLFKLYFDRYGTEPTFVFEGGGLTEDEQYIYGEELTKETYEESLQQLNAAVELFSSEFKKLGVSFEGAKYFYRYNAVEGYFNTFVLLDSPYPIMFHIMHVATRKHKSIRILTSAYDSHKQLIDTLIVKIGKLFPRERKVPDVIKIISQEGNRFSLTSFNLSSRQHDFDHDNYNDDFKQVSENIIAALCEQNESGLVLLHGGIGTGKTSFIKYLLRAVNTKQLIYVPPDLTPSLSAPSFMSFLVDNAKNSILLVEDAENVLKAREAGGSQAVSNILNISDGILGDILRLQIVCTFNCPLIQIDDALRRPGRLIAEYEFKKLLPDKTAKLMKKLYGDDVVYPDREMSLAEIYNFNSMPDKSNPDSKKIKLGFTA